MYVKISSKENYFLFPYSPTFPDWKMTIFSILLTKTGTLESVCQTFWKVDGHFTSDSATLVELLLSAKALRCLCSKQIILVSKNTEIFLWAKKAKSEFFFSRR